MRDALVALGWDAAWERAFAEVAAEGDRAARILEDHRKQVLYTTGADEAWAQIPGRLYRAAERDEAILPAVGDFVVLRGNVGSEVVHAVLPRRTRLARKAIERNEVQVVAANVDVVFVAEASAAVNVRRLERFLAVAADSGAQPVVVITKTDLEAAPPLELGVPVHKISNVTGQGVAELLKHLGPGRTGVVIGPSGVGKSTLINRWSGEERQTTGAVREGDQKGRHITTRRELVRLPDGSLVIDTPGVRELGLFDAEEGLAATFEDVLALATGCRFSDCTHEREPGCAVTAAVEHGALPAERLESWRKLTRELAHVAEKKDELARADAKRQARQAARALTDPGKKKRR